eukprot:CAMPEP_0119557622 /NCGR_PEP_ID=MMETSP1352-20130426/9240_1 /TAXON_ID=265584 /ORGANISM="Stauroneis constricta, Strain CCMP1120" /LENGTH=114 /DNA_ID=CAMNT_0007604759 /DNA_START=57 /DNA_END=401 /DNA_ORIENTATION=+
MKKQLKILTIQHCELKSISLNEYNELERVDLRHNSLDYIDVTKKNKLRILDVSYNQITKFRLEDCPELQQLSMTHNHLNANGDGDDDLMVGLSLKFPKLYQLDMEPQREIIEIL